MPRIVARQLLGVTGCCHLGCGLQWFAFWRWFWVLGVLFVVFSFFFPFPASPVFLFFLSPIFILLLLLFCLLSPFPSLLPSFLLISSPSLLFFFFFFFFSSFSCFLPWLLLTPSALRLPACSSCLSFVSFSCFFVGFGCFLFLCLSSSPVSLFLPPPVCCLPSLPALFLLSLPVFLSDRHLLGDTGYRHLCFPFCRLLRCSCPIPGLPPPPSFSFLLLLLLFLLSPTCL